MARTGEPTEQPTARRLDQARRRGEVAYSRDMVSAAATAAALAALAAGGPGLAARMVALFRASLSAAPAGGPPGPALMAGLGAIARALAAPLLAAATAALGVGLLQTRGLIAVEAVRPQLARLSPAVGLRRAFGGQAALQLARGLVKAALVGAIAWVTVRPALAGVAGLAGAAPPRLLSALGLLGQRMAARMVLAALGLGIADYLFARRRHMLDLRMTRDEVRRETREAEGDPVRRAQRLRLHREILEQRMVSDVRKADFVVVNPDHIAVALRYDRNGEAAPVVVASGERLVAEQIKEVARAAGVPVFRDVTLARSLRALPEGEEIPVALYEAVAEILRVVYGLDRGSGGAGARAGGPANGQDPGGTVTVARGFGWKRA